MNEIRSVCVFSASSARTAQVYVEAAKELGHALALRNIRLVNGAGCTGLMGACADACLQAGGEVTGVIPRFMVEQGWQHQGLTELIVTDDMHTRKQTMASLSDAAIALPGGCGTMEELLEIITWKQLGLYNKPVIVLNTAGYYDPLLRMLERAASEEFMRHIHLGLWQTAVSVAEAVQQLYSAPAWDNNTQKFTSGRP